MSDSKPLRRLARKTRLHSRKPIRRRRARPRYRGEFADLPYLAYLREQPCRAPGMPTHWGAAFRSDPHHLRHDEHGASLGAHVKDDRRAISLCREHHGDIELGTGPWKGWTRKEIKRWENQQVLQQRGAYLASTKE